MISHALQQADELLTNKQTETELMNLLLEAISRWAISRWAPKALWIGDLNDRQSIGARVAQFLGTHRHRSSSSLSSSAPIENSLVQLAVFSVLGWEGFSLHSMDPKNPVAKVDRSVIQAFNDVVVSSGSSGLDPDLHLLAEGSLYGIDPSWSVLDFVVHYQQTRSRDDIKPLAPMWALLLRLDSTVHACWPRPPLLFARLRHICKTNGLVVDKLSAEVSHVWRRDHRFKMINRDVNSYVRAFDAAVSHGFDLVDFSFTEDFRAIVDDGGQGAKASFCSFLLFIRGERAEQAMRVVLNRYSRFQYPIRTAKTLLALSSVAVVPRLFQGDVFRPET